MQPGFGSQLEARGWRQCRIISFEDSKSILSNPSQFISVEVDIDSLVAQDTPFYLVVVSQSCDIANDQFTKVELTVCTPIPSLDPMKCNSRNPRSLHTTANINPDDGDAYSQYLEIEIKRKLFVNKAFLASAGLEWFGQIQQLESQIFTRWLTGQYQRSAFPTAFNNRIHKERNKRAKKVKGLSQDLYAIYARVFPDKELGDSEHYDVRLLGVVGSKDEKIIEAAQKSLGEFASLMKDAGEEVEAFAIPHTKVTLAMIEGMQRLDEYDHLSYKNSDLLPPKV